MAKQHQRAPRKGQRVRLRPAHTIHSLWSGVRYEYRATVNGHWVFQQVGGSADFIFRDPDHTEWVAA